MNREKTLGVIFISGVAFLSFLVMFLSFYPGLFSPDLSEQLSQATGKMPFNDWHPPLMALIWKLGIFLTGKTSSLFVAEIFIFTLGLLLLSLSGFLTGRFSLFWSIVVVLLPLYAPILIQTGRQWKDQFLTFLLVAAIAALWMSGKKRRHLGLVLVFVFLASAAMLLRANGVFAIIFLLPLASWRVRQALFESPNSSARMQRISFKRKQLLSLACVIVSFLLVTGGYKAVIQVAAHPTPTHQVDQILLDDMVNVASVEEINALEISDGFKEHLTSAIVKCADLPKRRNLIWESCAEPDLVELEDGTRIKSGIAHYHDEFMTAWIHTIPKHLPRYIGYRFEMFSDFLFNTWNPSLENLETSFNPKFGTGFNATTAYVNSMANKWVRMLFCAGIYLFINIGTVVVATKNRERLVKDHFLFCFWLSCASIFWLLSQIPIVPVPDYRYAYFSIVATMLALIFLVSGIRGDQAIDSNKITCNEVSEEQSE